MAKDKPKEEDTNDAEEKEEKDAEGEGKEGEAEGEEGEGAAKKGSKKKIVIMGMLALLLLVGGAAGAYFAGLFGKHEEKTELTAGGKGIEKPIYYTMPEFIVNLNSGTRQISFLKMTVVLELNRPDDVPLVEANQPRLRDSMNTYLHELRASDLAGSAGILRLREEMLLRANKILAPAKIKDVLFSEIIVQ